MRELSVVSYTAVNKPFLEAPCRPAKPVLVCRALTLEAATCKAKKITNGVWHLEVVN